MQNVSLSLYVYEFQKHHGMVLYEWLLECAKKQGIHGGSAMRAIAGFGHHGRMHEEHFFELASNVPVQVVFIADENKIKELLEKLKAEKMHLFYAITPVECGFID